MMILFLVRRIYYLKISQWKVFEIAHFMRNSHVRLIAEVSENRQTAFAHSIEAHSQPSQHPRMMPNMIRSKTLHKPVRMVIARMSAEAEGLACFACSLFQ